MTRHFIPDKYQILSGSMLKILALVTMIIDHIASVFLRSNPTVLVTILGRTITLYTAMRFIGRLSFPIYAFLLVEGFMHTSNKRNYAIRILVFSLISEVAWDLEHFNGFNMGSQNVFFTLFLGLLGMFVLSQIEEQGPDIRKVAALVLLIILSVILKCDYGISGFGFIVMLYILRNNRLYQAVVGACFLASRWQAGLAFIPISLYNGKRGFINTRTLSNLFYLAYPLHMLILYYIKLKSTGY